MTALRDLWQEARETGPWRLGYRCAWELALRSGALGLLPPPGLRRGNAAVLRGHAVRAADWLHLLPLADPDAVAQLMRPRLPRAQRAALQAQATRAAGGRIVAFGALELDYGSPIDWHRDPRDGSRWPAAAPWWRSMRGGGASGDIKLPWEIGRFPHAYAMARAAAFAPRRREALAGALYAQMRGFARANPAGRGVHWASGQEIAVRAMAWTFALATLLSRSSRRDAAAALTAAALVAGAVHVRRYLSYARIAVPNNHVLAEGLLLLLAGTLQPSDADAAAWRRIGTEILAAGAERQVYRDGAYIQHSHTYHRVALQYFLWASALRRVGGAGYTAPWDAAVARSLDFLLAQQNPRDGSLPNFGANDGALPCIGSSCAYGDFRPVLQAAALQVRGERLYRPGPWDEPAAWLLGPPALTAARRPPPRRSVSFLPTGMHLLRGRDRRTLVALRCGTLADRFAQMDMLHLDVTWRGHNVLVDGGSYRYNGAPAWHQHFARTASHNTVTLDGLDQMLHLRQFKHVYLTQARRLSFAPQTATPHMAGAHWGFARHAGGCVHVRTVWLQPSGRVVVLDRIEGRGTHTARLHWLAGPWPHTYREDTLRLQTPDGPYALRVYGADGRARTGDVLAGERTPPRGWLSRSYAQKRAVASLAVTMRSALPLHLVTVMGPPPLPRALRATPQALYADALALPLVAAPTAVRADSRHCASR